MTLKFLSPKEERSEKAEIAESLRDVKEKLRQNENLFNLAVSSELIDFAVYRDIALKAQYDYLIKKYREF